MKKYLQLTLSLLALLGLLALAACGGGTTTEEAAPEATAAPVEEAPAEEAPAEEAPAAEVSNKVGIVLPTKDEPRWVQDETRFREALSAAGYEVEILFSQGDSAKERANVEDLITKGVKVLIITPHDGTAAAAAAQVARDAGVKVISYDRLIRETDAVDYYVTFDSLAVGAQQAQYLVDNAEGTGNPLYLYAGAASDNNAFIFFEGAWKVLQPKIADGTFVIKNSSEAEALSGSADLTREQYAQIIGQVTTNWDFNTAKSLAEANLTAAAAEDKGNVFILAPNDGTARAIADAFAADADVTSYLVTGQDAEKASVQYIIDGKQSMTVFKDVRTLVDDAIAAAVALLSGSEPTASGAYNNGVIDVPAIQSPVVTVDQGNVVEALITSGYYTEADFTGLDTMGQAPAEMPTLRIWADDTRKPGLDAVEASFEEEYGVDLVIEQVVFGDIRTLMATAAPAGEGPDIIVGAHDWLGEMVTSGLVAPVDLGEKAAEFDPVALQAFSYNGELYGVPNATENVALFVNTDISPECPATWTEVYEASAALAANNTEDVETNQYGFIRQEGDPYHFYPIETAFGGYVFGENADGSYNAADLGVGNEGSIAAGEWLARMVAEGLQPPAVDWETMHAWFETGKAAMIVTGPWATQRIVDSGVPFQICNLPSETTEGRPFLGAQGFMVSAFSKDPLLAQVFLTEFVATPEVMTSFFETGQRPPAYLPALEAAAEDPYVAAFAEAGANAYPMPAIPEMASVWEAWGNAVVLVQQGADTAENAFTTAAEQIKTALGQ